MAGVLNYFLIWVAPFALMITSIIVIHELGHFLVARACGVAIDQFSVGFGRALWSRKDRSGVEWRIGWLPLGGYVKFAGDSNAASVPDQTDLTEMRAAIVASEGVGAEKKYLVFKPLWQRALIVLGGPAANFFLAIVLYSIFLGAFGELVTSTKVDSVIPGGAAAHAGFRAGDVIKAADGRAMGSFQDVQTYVQYRAGVPIDFTVERLGAAIHVTATPSAVQEKSPVGGDQTVGRLGLAARGGALKHYGPLEAVERGFIRTAEISETTLYFLGRIVTGQVAFDQLHGVVGIAQASGSITQHAVADAREAGVNPLIATAFVMIQMAGMMSVSVGILNLLPIPVLDGGHLMFYAYEFVVRRPPRAAVQAVAFRAGLALLVVLMVLANWNDLQRQHLFHFLGS